MSYNEHGQMQIIAGILKIQDGYIFLFMGFSARKHAVGLMKIFFEHEGRGVFGCAEMMSRLNDVFIRKEVGLA